VKAQKNKAEEIEIGYESENKGGGFGKLEQK